MKTASNAPHEADQGDATQQNVEEATATGRAPVQLTDMGLAMCSASRVSTNPRHHSANDKDNEEEEKEEALKAVAQASEDTRATSAEAETLEGAVVKAEEAGEEGTTPIRVRIPGHRPPTYNGRNDEGDGSGEAKPLYLAGGVDVEVDVECGKTKEKEKVKEEAAPQQAAKPAAEAWSVDFSFATPKTSRKTTKKERDALRHSCWRKTTATATTAADGAGVAAQEDGEGEGGLPTADSEGNTTTTTATTATAGTRAGLRVVNLDDLIDRDALIPQNLTSSTREAVQQRLCLRLPRLLCVNKQYPRSCGITSLASIYNYLYSWLGECPQSAATPPVSQEELMSILGFEPPFGEILWGGFTGNTTLIRWFYALNRHFKRPRGRAYILYKAHGHGKTTHLFDNDNKAILAEVKRVLRDPHCALIYHCYNHYMCPIGYQDVPVAQTDFLKPQVAEESCDTTIFIGEVSRGRHEAMYARKWCEIVKDIECKSPYFFNTRHPELGVQMRTKAGSVPAGNGGAKKKQKAKLQPQQPQQLQTEDARAPPATATEDNSAEAITTTTTPAAGVEVTEPKEPDAIATPTDTEEKVEEEKIDQQVEATATTSTPTVSAAVAASAVVEKPPAASKRERGNLHCLICFRNDEEEVNPALYEHLSDRSDGSSSSVTESDADEPDARRGRIGSSEDDTG